MLIKFALRPEQISKVDATILEEVVSELLRAHRYGFHLLVMNRDSARFLLGALKFSERDKALLQRLSSDYTQTGALCTRSSIYMEISTVPSFQVIGNALIVPIQLLNHSNLGKPAGLLVEDGHRDGFIMKFVLENVSHIHKVPRISFEIKHGGGSVIKKSFDSEVEAKHITFCLLDTDKISPSGNICLTSSTILSCSGSGSWPLVIAEALPCHEIENFIPHEIVTMLTCGHGCKWNTLFPKIQDWEEANSVSYTDRFWLFFDIKNGLSSEIVSTIHPDDKSWIEDRLLAAGLEAGPWQYTGYGQNVLSILRTDNAALSELKKALRKKTWLEVFSPLCQRLLWFFVAATPLKT